MTKPHEDQPIKEKGVNRVEFLKNQFVQDYKKAIKKNKFLKLQSLEYTKFLKKLETNEDLFAARIPFSPPPTEEQEISLFVDPAFFAFKLMIGITKEEEKKPLHELMFEFFMNVDPTPHKEYLNWFLNLYRDLLKQRKPFSQVSEKILDKSLIQDGSFSDFVMGGDENRFFEDMFKVSEALEKFNFIKKTKTIKEEQKDINRFQTYTALLKLVKPFMSAAEGSDAVDTLDHKELRSIENQLDYEKGSRLTKDDPRAELVYQDEKWVIVHTINRQANTCFGKYTTWCTAGTRYGNMFDNYNKDGKLFVLIKKGEGSKSAIDDNPQARLQFHFESNQYMDANDKAIKIAKFLEENEGIKEYFKHYIVRNALPKKSSKVTDQIKLLSDLGYGDQIIKIYKEVQPSAIDLTGFTMKPEFLEELGDITSLETLTLSDCGLTALPQSLTKLKKLKYLNVTANPMLQEIPSWLNKLTNLSEVAFSSCDIQNEIDFSGMTKLTNVRLDYNPNLGKFPKGLNDAKDLVSLTLSNCNLVEVSDDILSCKKLMMLDVHYNLRLKKMPIRVTTLPELYVVCFDDTQISEKDINDMQKVSIGLVELVKYPS